MTPFQLAWVFLKTEMKPKPHPSENYLYDGTNAQLVRDSYNPPLPDEGKHFSQQLSDLFNPPSPDDMTPAQIEAEMRSFESNPQNSAYINLRDPNHPAPKPAPMGRTLQTRLPSAGSGLPFERGDISHRVENNVMLQNAGRRLADQKEKARAHLNQYPPRLYRQKDSDGANYTMMAGDKNLGNIGVERNNSKSWPVGTKEPADKYNIGYGEVNRPYQRQGLYGSALQGIINDTGSLTSTARNRQSGPFHEQFNPPNVKRQRGGKLGNEGAYDYSEINYTQLPAKETPRDWGDLQYDTGAMPVFEDKGPQGQPPALNPRDREQASLARWGYIPGNPRYN